MDGINIFADDLAGILDDKNRGSSMRGEDLIRQEGLPAAAISGTGELLPEALFLAEASTLSFGGLVMLGMELCGRYRMEARAGSATYYRLHDPRTSQNALIRFLEGMPEAPHQPEALLAAGFLQDGSPAPLASFLCALAVLPSEIGGFGMPHPRFAVPIGQLENDLLRLDLLFTQDGYSVGFLYTRTLAQAMSLHGLMSCVVDGVRQPVYIVNVTDDILADRHRILSVVWMACKAFAGSDNVPESGLETPARLALVEGMQPPIYGHMSLSGYDLAFHPFAD